MKSANEFLTIGDAARRSGVAASALRFYESRGLISSLRVSGKSLSKQSYNLCAKIREVDAYRGDPRMYEVHPETSFRVLAGEESVPSKKTWGGLHARLTLLREAGIEVPGHRASIGHVGIDDVVDAAAAAWSARRIGESVAITFPSSEEQRDADGRLIAIWA